MAAPALGKGDPEHYQAARAFLKTMLESGGLPEATAARPIQYSIGHGECAATPKRARGQVTDAARAKALETCLLSAKKGFGDKVDEVAAEDVTLKAFLQKLDAADRASAKALAKGGKIVSLGWNGDGETLLIYVVVGKDSAIKGIWVTAEATE